jgi:hypothetical protein
LKRNQLRELAALNGTLRDDENQACQNCGQIGHRKYDCPEKQNYTASIICRVCGNAGHMARDCPDRQRGASWRNDGPVRPGAPGAPRIGGGDAVDREYEVRRLPFQDAQSCANPFHSNSCKNWVAPVLLLRASKPGPGLMDPSAELAALAAAMPGLGHAARPAALLPGVLGTTTATTAALLPTVLPLVLRVVLLHGLATAATAIGTVATAARMAATEATAIILVDKARTVAPLPPLRAPLLGTSPWPRRPHMVDTQATGLTGLLALLLVLLLESALLLPACLHRLLPVAHHPVSLVVLTRSSSSTLMPFRPRLRRRREMRRPRPRPWTCRLLRRALRENTSTLTLLRCIVHWAAGMLLTDRMFVDSICVGSRFPWPNLQQLG